MGTLQDSLRCHLRWGSILSPAGVHVQVWFHTWQVQGECGAQEWTADCGQPSNQCLPVVRAVCPCMSAAQTSDAEFVTSFLRLCMCMPLVASLERHLRKDIDSAFVLYFWYFNYYVVWVFFWSWLFGDLYVLLICALNSFSTSGKFCYSYKQVVCALCAIFWFFANFNYPYFRLLWVIWGLLYPFFMFLCCFLRCQSLSLIDHWLQPSPLGLTLCLCISRFCYSDFKSCS